MSYYWFDREKLMENVWDKYHNKEVKKKLPSIIEKLQI